MRRNHGLTLIEMLVALAIFATMAGAVTAGITVALRAQAVNEAATTAQARLRRVTEVVTQELRSSVLGGLASTPYPATSTSVSFVLLDGGAGYVVLPTDQGNNFSFPNADHVNIISSAASAADLGLEGGQAIMVNGLHDAVLFDVNNVSNGGYGPLTYNVVHAGCANTIDYTGPADATVRASSTTDASTVLVGASSRGFRFDPATGTLYETIGTGAALPLAFDLSDVRLAYVYETDDGTPVVRSTPLDDGNGVPTVVGTIGGSGARLARISLTVSADIVTNGRTLTRTYTGEVEFPRVGNDNVTVHRVLPCN